ncbi:RDD family protein [Rhodococcus sp. NPDC127530]|uniref:RDD family protein n=1 Tax=unclassified Rhodococcus (in: high G+C Gram-positive bacteria) TaxID=192944 RepID=UPI003643B808
MNAPESVIDSEIPSLQRSGSDSDTGSDSVKSTVWQLYSRRAAAAALDYLPPIIVVGSVFVTVPALGSPSWATTVAVITATVTTLAFIWNAVLLQGTQSTTIGKSAFGLRTQSSTALGPIGVLRASIKLVAHLIDVATLLLGFLWPLWDSKRQTFSDKLASAVVVSTNRSSCSTRLTRRVYVSWCAAPIVFLALMVSAQFVVQRSADDQRNHAMGSVAQVASGGATAVLSYRPETVDQDLAAAAELLTGDFRDSYQKLAAEVVGPTSRQKNITMQATVVGTAVESVADHSASVLVYVNQVTTGGDGAEPTQSQNAIRVGLVNEDGRWLIDKFDPQF